MFIENIYFSDTDEARYSGFNSMVKRKKGKIPKVNQSEVERIFNKITPDIVEYTGNKGFKVKTKNKIRCPDFKIRGQNKVIEIFGIYYHDILKVKNGNEPDNPKDLIREYKEVGIDCLVFWEYEIIKIYGKQKKYPKPDLKKVLKRTLEFIKDYTVL